MKTLILIGNKDFVIESITRLNFKQATKSYFSIDTRFVVEYEEGHVFFDISSDIVNGYDKCELEEIPFEPCHFVVLSSSSQIKLEEIIRDNEFDNNLYIDNDHGLITSVTEFRKFLEAK